MVQNITGTLANIGDLVYMQTSAESGSVLINLVNYKTSNLNIIFESSIDGTTWAPVGVYPISLTTGYSAPIPTTSSSGDYIYFFTNAQHLRVRLLSIGIGSGFVNVTLVALDGTAIGGTTSGSGGNSGGSGNTGGNSGGSSGTPGNSSLGTVQAITSSGDVSIAINPGTGYSQYVITLTQPTANITFTNALVAAGTTWDFEVVLIQGTGANQVTWNNNSIRWQFDRVPVLAYQQHYADIITFSADPTMPGRWMGFTDGSWVNVT